MKFTPEIEGNPDPVPFLEDVRAEDGWKGHSTNKSVAKLRAEISAEIGRMHGTMTGWMRGEFDIDGQKRVGIQINYQVVSPGGQPFEGRIDVAALPYHANTKRSDRDKINHAKAQKSLAMALLNVREALQSSRILQTLSPGYSALMPWILTEGDQTVSQLYSESMNVKSLPVPDPENEEGVVEAKFREVSD